MYNSQQLIKDLNSYSAVKLPHFRSVRLQHIPERVKNVNGRGQLKCDGTRAETRFRLSAKRTSTFKSEGESVSIIGSRGVRISGSNAGYTMFRGSVKSTGYTLHSPVSTSLPLPCVTVCHHISTGLHHNYVGCTGYHRSNNTGKPTWCSTA